MNRFFLIILLIIANVCSAYEGYYLLDDNYDVNPDKMKGLRASDLLEIKLPTVEPGGKSSLGHSFNKDLNYFSTKYKFSNNTNARYPGLITIKATKKTKKKKNKKKKYDIIFEGLRYASSRSDELKKVKFKVSDVPHKKMDEGEFSLSRYTKTPRKLKPWYKKYAPNQSMSIHRNTNLDFFINENGNINIYNQTYYKVPEDQIDEVKRKFNLAGNYLTKKSKMGMAKRNSFRNDQKDGINMPELLVYEFNDYVSIYKGSKDVSMSNLRADQRYGLDRGDLKTNVLGAVQIIKRASDDFVPYKGEIFGNKTNIDLNLRVYDDFNRNRYNATSPGWYRKKDLEINFLDIPSKSTGKSFSSYRDLIPPEIIKRNFKDSDNWSVFYFDSLRQDLYIRHLSKNLLNMKFSDIKDLYESKIIIPLSLKRMNLASGNIDEVLKIEEPLSYVVSSNKLPEGHLLICNIQKTKRDNEITVSLKMFDFYNSKYKSELKFNTDFDLRKFIIEKTPDHLNSIYSEPKWNAINNKSGDHEKRRDNFYQQAFMFKSNMSKEGLFLFIFNKGVMKFIKIDDKIHEPLILNQTKDNEVIFESKLPEEFEGKPFYWKNIPYRLFDKIDGDLIFQIDDYNNILISNLKTNALERKYGVIQIKNQMLSESDYKLLNRFYSDLELSHIFKSRIKDKIFLIDHIVR